jgi:hypothetical protein
MRLFSFSSQNAIHINKALATIGRESASAIVKYRCAFLTFAIIAHSLSHHTRRGVAEGESPVKYYPGLDGGNEAEADEWLEQALFGGLITSVRGPRDLSGGLQLRKKKTGRTVRIDDGWLRTTVCLYLEFCLSQF